PLLANSVATIVYAPPRHVSVYASFSGLIVAPFYGLFSLGGGLVANIASLDSVFMISLALYAAALVFVLSLRRRNAAYGRAVPGSGWHAWASQAAVCPKTRAGRPIRIHKNIKLTINLCGFTIGIEI